MTHTNKNTDSKTKVYQKKAESGFSGNDDRGAEKEKKVIKVHGGRTVLSIRCRPEIKRQLMAFCRKNGVSVCHIFEAMTTGYLEGMKQKINWVNQSPTIELSVVREVKRIRRYVREIEGFGVQVETRGSFEKCAYGCSDPVVAKHNMYSDKDHCTEMYVCAKHHKDLKLRSSGYKLF